MFSKLVLWFIDTLYIISIFTLMNFFYKNILYKKIIEDIYKELYELSPVIATIYLTTRSIREVFSFILRNSRYKKYWKKKLNSIFIYGWQSIGCGRRSDKDYTDAAILLVDIINNPMRYLESLDAIYSLIVDELDSYKISIEEKDERISFILFMDFFAPFGLIFALMIYNVDIGIINLFLPLLNLTLIYITFLVFKNW